jgi:two-component system chemotaxis response regulator CheB
MKKRDIIVIGTSAGGLNALKQLIKSLTPTLEITLLIVIHTSARSPNMLKEILQKNSSFPIINPTNGQIIRRNHIYLAPPNFHMTVNKGHIFLNSGPRINHSRPAIDPLFRSVALQYGARVVGIILTGMLDDGTAGLEVVKKQGGLTIVQHPEDAEYPEMPRNALASVKVDHCSTLPEIALLIAKVTATPVKSKLKFASHKMQIETKSNTTDITSTAELNHVGKISSFTCPECHGTLWEIKENNKKILRYRCRIGHAFGSKSLLAAHDETLENILWAAVRTLEENAELSHRLAARVSKTNIHTTSFFSYKAKIAQQNVKKLKKILLHNEIKKVNFL